MNSALATISCSPTITTQPASQTITSGNTATLTVTASGSTPLTYQWYRGAVGTTTTPVGTNSASFTTPALTATTSYWVRVSNSAGSVNSVLATISCSPAITTQPASQTIASGSTTTLTVTANGPAPLTYQWYQGAVGTTTTPVGTNSSSFTTPSLTETTSFWVSVSNSAGSVNSALATISCSPVVISQPASQTILSGNTATLTVTANGPAPLTYQWYQGAVGTSTTPVGTNSASFTTPALSATTTYWVRVSNTAGSVNSTLATITCSPAITTQPVSQTIVSGNTATLTVTANGSTPLTYQWYRGAVGTTTTPVGTNSASFTTPALSATTSYWVRVSNSAGSVDSTLATISCSPTITTQPPSATIASGSTTTLSVIASGSTTLTYQWYQGSVGTTTAPVGANSASFTTPVLTTTRTYWVRVSNSFGSVNSNLCTILIRPSISVQPTASSIITAGNSKTLTVEATGPGPLTYQWYQGAVGTTSTPVGTNSASYTTPALNATTSYWVRVSNSAGSVNSTLATISCAPIITIQPGSPTVVSGSTATISVTASGSSPLTYQWYQGEVGNTSLPVGTNSRTYTTPTLNNSVGYWVRVSNSVGQVNSQLSSISVSPRITSQPTSTTVDALSSATLTVSASGPSPLTYDWYKGDVGDISSPVGSNASSYTTPPLTNTANYWVRVSNSAGSVNSTLASIRVRPSITTQPISNSILAGATTNLSVAAIGTTPFTYQWYRGETGITSNPVGSNSSSFTVPVITDTTKYWVRVTNTAGSVNSAAATITVSPAITSHPVSRLISVGSTITLTVGSSGSGPLSYQWYQGSLGVTNNPVGTNSATFTSSELLLNTSFWVRVSNAAGSSDSSVANITLLPGIQIQPISPIIDSGSNTTLTVSAIGPGPIWYQWYQGNVGVTSSPAGSNSPSFTTPAFTNTALYWVRVFNLNGSIDSLQSTISVRPRIIAQPQSPNVSSGEAATISVAADGSTPLNYQWYRGQIGDTANPVGSNSSTYTTPPLRDVESYWVRVSNQVGSSDSAQARITVRPIIITQPSTQVIDSGTTATFSVVAQGPSNLQYQWYRYVNASLSTAVGDNSPTFTTNATTITDLYWVRVSNDYGSVDSAFASVDLLSTIPPGTFWMGRTSGDTDADAPPILVNMNHSHPTA